MTKILIVEDDESLREALVYNLRREDYDPLVAVDAASAVRLASQEKPGLIVLDLMLPGGSGFDVCRSIRVFSKAPIIMLTARNEPVDRIIGLEVGADDYVTKPFNLRELLARIKANLRRVGYDQEPGDDPLLEHGPLRVNVASRQVELKGGAVTLQPKEFDLLVYLMQNEGVVLTRERLLFHVWGHEFVGERTVDVHVRRLRSKLERAEAETLIRTIHGVGYAFGEEGALAKRRPG